MNTRRQFLLLPLVGALADPPPDWSALRRALKGTLVRPGEATYDASRRLFNPAFDRVRPSAVAYCATPADVSTCLTFARKNRVGITARSGGHSYAGWSTGTGLVIDVSRLNAVSHSGGRAVVGAGSKLIDVYDKLGRQGVSIPAGSCPSVGVGGLTLGGGIGVVSRKYGLTCDALESIQVVTADGRVLTCDAGHNADLFWACRGGGGGNFGIATSFTFRTHRTRDVTVFFLHWPWAKASAALRAWQSWAPSAPDELWSNLHLKRERAGLDVMIGGLYVGGQAALDRLLKPLVDKIGPPSSRYVKPKSYQAAMMVMAGCSGKTVAQCRTPGRESFVATSHLAFNRLSADGVKALVARVERPGQHAVLLDAMGGAIARVPASATAFPHRSALFTVQYYDGGTDRTWIRGARASMNPYLGDHAYVNYIDPDLPEWRRAYYGANADRLAAIKSARDPDRLFNLPQSL
ncbi:FAD-binding oxidoreductase [Nonomuraea sp. NPDC050556]|uniref:FAD-binding oxidoreductase n=1 Tax=Nonomuraea sp. NPDC050556 TaxID=3364369 RepID=UPI0037AB160D